ncbi:MAG: hypothetical protein J0L66_01260 [Cytophagales bacterium]|nr:hypothetical protein [Cytophagales bacterium]
MNIYSAVEFNPREPSVVLIEKTGTLKMFCVALCKDQLLQKHQAHVPSFLVVVKGSVDFLVGAEVVTLQELDTYRIPLKTDHEVKGRLDQNIILITQELNPV